MSVVRFQVGGEELLMLGDIVKLVLDDITVVSWIPVTWLPTIQRVNVDIIAGHWVRAFDIKVGYCEMISCCVLCWSHQLWLFVLLTMAHWFGSSHVLLKQEVKNHYVIMFNCYILFF